MKRNGVLFVISAFVLAIFVQMNANENRTENPQASIVKEYKFPKKVKAVIDKSCYGCHSENGKSDKAKDAFRWDQMHEYDNAKLVSVMEEIIEVIEEEEMPPKKMLEKKIFNYYDVFNAIAHCRDIGLEEYLKELDMQ